MAKRFLQTYTWYGIERSEIPDFLAEVGGPSLDLADLSEERLLDHLRREHLDVTTDTFDLDRDWLRHENADKVLRSYDFYKHVGSFADFLLVSSRWRKDKQLWGHSPNYAGGTIYFLASAVPSISDFDQAPWKQVGGILKVPIFDFRGRTIHRYFALDAQPWEYPPAHYDLVAMMTIADECGLLVLGRFVTVEQVAELSSGRLFPYRRLLDSNRNTWRPPYPDLGPSARSLNEDYQKKWTPYLTLFREQKYLQRIHEAREARRNIMWGKNMWDDI